MDGVFIGRIIVLVTMAGSGILLLWVARAAGSGRLGRNQFAGIRTADTLASDEAWLAAHARAEKPTLLAGVFSIATGVAGLLPVSAAVFGAVVLTGAMLMLVPLLYGTVVGARAARETSAWEAE